MGHALAVRASASWCNASPFLAAMVPQACCPDETGALFLEDDMTDKTGWIDTFGGF